MNHPPASDLSWQDALFQGVLGHVRNELFRFGFSESADEKLYAPITPQEEQMLQAHHNKCHVDDTATATQTGDAFNLVKTHRFDTAVKAICKLVMPDHPLPPGEASWEHFKAPMARPGYIGYNMTALNEEARKFAFKVIQQFIDHDAAALRMLEYLVAQRKPSTWFQFHNAAQPQQIVCNYYGGLRPRPQTYEEIERAVDGVVKVLDKAFSHPEPHHVTRPGQS